MIALMQLEGRYVKYEAATGLAGFLICVLALQGCIGGVPPGTIATGAIAIQDRRTIGSYIDDELIEIKMRAAIFDRRDLSTQVHVSVTSFDGLVLLSGEAPGESLRTRVVEIARSISSVRAVQNEIQLAAPSSYLTRARDTVITGKVKVALVEDEMLNPVHIKVVTEQGVVYLMGLVTQAEADRATEVARRVGGVRRVVKVMEYIE